MSLRPQSVYKTGPAASTSSSTTLLLTLDASAIPTGQINNTHMVVVWVALAVGRSVSSVTYKDGTFVRAASCDRGEIWVGYGFSASDTATSLTVTYDAATTRRYFIVNVIEFSGAVTTAPSFGTPASATGSTSPAAPGTVTPAVGDLVLELIGYESATAPSGATDTPGGTEQFEGSVPTTAAVVGAYNLHRALRVATSTSATQRSLSIPAVAWTAVVVGMTVTQGSSDRGTPHVYKGRASRADDTVGAT